MGKNSEIILLKKKKFIFQNCYMHLIVHKSDLFQTPTNFI